MNPPPPPPGKSGLGKSAPIRTVASSPPTNISTQKNVSNRLPRDHTNMTSNNRNPQPQYRAATAMSPNENPKDPELHAHVVPLPPPQQTQTHPLGTSTSHQQYSYAQTQPKQFKSPQPPPPQIASQSPPSQSPSASQPRPPKTHQPFSPSRGRTPTTPDEEVDAFLLSHTDKSTTPKTRPSPLPQTDNSLEKAKLLASRRAWGDVIRVTNDALIANSSQEGVTHHHVYSQLIAAAASSEVDVNANQQNLATIRRETCEFIALRCIAHLKLRRYVDLGQEIAQLGLIPHLPPHPSSITDNHINSLSWKEGSINSQPKDKLPPWVPHGLRIMAAQQLQYVDGSSKAIDVLYDLRDRSVRHTYWQTSQGDIWTSTIDNALVNAFVRKKEWRMALCTIDHLLNGMEGGVEREVEFWCRDNLVGHEDRQLVKDLLMSCARVELMSRQILILLQVGALDAARVVQDEVSQEVKRIQSITQATNKRNVILRLEKESALVRQAPFRLKVNEGLLIFASGQGNFTNASHHFREALLSQKEFDKAMLSSLHPLGCPTWRELSNPTLGFSAESSLTVECLNNLALCLLYSGNMRHAVHELEGLVREDPTMYLTEGMAFNLCTLYELGSDGEECTRRKKLLQRVAKRFFLHDVGVESFRLN